MSTNCQLKEILTVLNLVFQLLCMEIYVRKTFLHIRFERRLLPLQEVGLFSKLSELLLELFNLRVVDFNVVLVPLESAF